ncbi:MAG: response regulator [Elusimicrobia bacterium]|nr:response regulator [Elusimicrobiota bacterium]
MVDDEPDFLAIARNWLSRRYEVTTLMDGSDLPEQIDALEPDLLVLDIRLPGADGLELCRQIRSNRRFDRLPILFLTASHSDIDFFRNIEVGGTAFLTKPITRRTLLSKIQELLS